MENHVSTLPTDLENEEVDEDDEEEGEEEDEVVELDDPSNAMPMTSRVSSFGGGSVVDREQTRFNHDKEILLETSGFVEKCLQPGPVSDPTPL